MPICCGKELTLKVCHSAAGWYIGFTCPYCGPYDRCSDYMSQEDAESLLKIMKNCKEITIESYAVIGLQHTVKWE